VLDAVGALQLDFEAGVAHAVRRGQTRR